MPIQVMLCCNDDHGNFTGRATRIDFSPYKLEIEECCLPARGVPVRFTAKNRVRIGLRAYPIVYHQTWVGNIFGNIYWDAIGMRGIDAFGLMNYMHRLKYWHATAGECYLFDQFNAKKFIDPQEYFKRQREEQERRA